jgi:hypothetical protein
VNDLSENQIKVEKIIQIRLTEKNASQKKDVLIHHRLVKRKTIAIESSSWSKLSRFASILVEGDIKVLDPSFA